MWRRLQPYVAEAATLCAQAKELALAERAEEAKSAPTLTLTFTLTLSRTPTLTFTLTLTLTLTRTTQPVKPISVRSASVSSLRLAASGTPSRAEYDAITPPRVRARLGSGLGVRARLG